MSLATNSGDPIPAQHMTSTPETFGERLHANIRVYGTILRTCIEERLVYRGDFIFATFVRFLPIVTQIFLWAAIYKTSTNPGGQILNGYSYPDMVAYYLIAMVGRAFSSMPGLSTGIATDIRDGDIKKFLTQPVDYLGYLFWYRVAHKLVYYLMAAIPFGIVFYLCGSYFTHSPSALEWSLFAVALINSFLIGFLMEALLGLLAFWFLEVGSLIFIFMMFTYFLSGHMIPLDWLPKSVNDAFYFLPFKYLAYTPAAILLGKYTPVALWQETLLQFVWVFILYYANRVAFDRGVKHYSAFGG
jgi:ABC-2 type transport system permease protein